MPTRIAPAFAVTGALGVLLIGTAGGVLGTRSLTQHESPVIVLTSGRPADGVADTSGAAPAGVDLLAVELDRRFWDDVEPLLAQYCFSCHSEETTKGGVGFDRIWSLDDALGMGDDLAMARELLHGKAMPPDGEPAPSDHEILTIARWIDDALAYTPPDGAVDPGWFIIHRLNRSEYRNTLRDLLDIDPTTMAGTDLAAGLPQDDTGYGFDNIAAVLSMSPLRLEGYLDAGERALEIGLGPVADVSDTPVPIRGLEARRGGRVHDDGGFMLLSNGSVTGVVDVPATGEYEIRVHAWGQRGGDELPRMSVRVDRREVAGVSIEAERGGVQEVAVQRRLERGRHEIAAHFTNDFYVPGVADRNLGVLGISLAGPLDAATIERPAGHGAVFFVTPDEAGDDREAARAVIGRFASRAFRRPAEAGEVDRLLGLYDRARDAGDSHERAARVGLLACLVSPSFLYRSVDNPAADDPHAIYTLNAYELASRLSYFLWSSVPDDALLSLAASGALLEEGTLRGEVARMLADPKSDAFIENFSGQWLLLRNLERLSIDRERFPEYSSELRAAMTNEATMFFADVVRNDRSVMSFLDSDHTFVNGPLAALYGLAELAGTDFQRVELPEGSARGGILTMGAVLTVTSNPTRTSPVKRGLYVLDQILGTPPPPPPSDIPPLERAMSTLGENPSLREQLNAHLTDINCAVCHSRMDPLGLAFENFDAIGAWRDRDESGTIDASGALPSGVSFVGPRELKAILLERGDLFVENLTRKVLTYALGRGLAPFDRPTVTRITRGVRENADRFSAIIEGVVLSEAFKTSRGLSPADQPEDDR